MFKKIKDNSFQLSSDPFYTKIPTWYFEMYNINIGLLFVDEYDAQGRVLYYSDSIAIAVIIRENCSEDTIIHEAVHVKQFLEEHWGTKFDSETEAILVSKISLFIEREFKKHTKKKKFQNDKKKKK